MDLSDLSKSQLHSLCKEKGIKGYTTKSKEEVMSLLQEWEHNDYVMQTMLTCIGNKRKLVSYIYDIIDDIRVELGKDKLNIVDGFAGSSVVSRKLSYLCDKIYTNDLELYAYLMAKCYLMKPSESQIELIQNHINIMNEIATNGPYVEGIICKYYAPEDTNNIQLGERCFYTRENALIIDTLRKYISDNIEDDIQVYCLVPLLNKASIHTNTSGVFKGFHKKNNIGCFGGSQGQALSRILKPIRVDMPLWSKNDFQAICYNKDINILIEELPDDIDLIYLDPPYNQHPYGSNYFMLNVIAKNEEPGQISQVSGIPVSWQKSNYNTYKTAVNSMKNLIEIGLKKAKYILISYNNEGIIPVADWNNMLECYQVKKYEIKYDTFKGCRNLANRNDKVVEIMYLVSKIAS